MSAVGRTGGERKLTNIFERYLTVWVAACMVVGVAIGKLAPGLVEAVRSVEFDLVVTVCGHANESCPAWLKDKAKVLHVGFDDPPALAAGARTEEEALSHYRRVRDQIRAFVEQFQDFDSSPQ